jgi:hypothetical protein
MSQTDSESVDRGSVRKAIYATASDADGNPPRESVVTAVVTDLVVRERVVQTEIDKLADHGFIYLTDGDQGVKVA